jgi:hypothetical protein
MRGQFQSQGLDGGIVVTDGETWTAGSGGGSRWVSVLTDTVLSSYEGNIRSGDTVLVGPTLAAGTDLGGIATEIGVTTGIVIVYELGSQGTVA